MPFVFGNNERTEPTTKRRKLYDHNDNTIMARCDEEPSQGTVRWDLEDPSTNMPTEQEQSESGITGEVIRTSSREELMECIKRGQKPFWVPKPTLQALCKEEAALNARRRLVPGADHPQTQSQSNETATEPGQQLEAAQSKAHDLMSRTPYEKPRSAFHRGDFAETDSLSTAKPWTSEAHQPGLAISTYGTYDGSTPDWYSLSPRSTSLEAMSHVRAPSQLNTSFINRRRAPSLGSSLSSSFVMRAPTSPLVQATNNPNLDLSEDGGPDIPRSQNPRRRTMPPNSFHSLSMTPFETTPPNFSRPFAPAMRREVSLPTHANQPQRPMSSFTYHPRSNPHTPMIRSRRQSMASGSGARRRTSMVGSFEESILRGRMSTPPSKPLDFVAQIGVMGKGDCPSSLKCPAHVSVPFPAVFYSYPASAGIRSVSDDTPSPYVGTINLDHNLKVVTLAENPKKLKKTSTAMDTQAVPSQKLQDFDDLESVSHADKIRVGGAYRVPQVGQLQIIIKNPNKTAVKLFLVPYDLTGMEAGQKTFVRQRSYSTGPVVEHVLGDKGAKSTIVDPLKDKHILRYLMHVRFCCPAKNRLYLYDTIRVVFANRVPDGKEKLRDEVQIPEPKFSPWKPLNVEAIPKGPKSAPGTPNVNTFEIGSHQFFGDMDGFQMTESPTSPTPSERLPPQSPQLPFQFPFVPPKVRSPPLWRLPSSSPSAERTPFDFRDIDRTAMDTPKPKRALSPVMGFTASTPLRGSPIPWRSPPGGDGPTRSFSPATPEPGDGLLSKQLRGLSGPTSMSRQREHNSSDGDRL